MELNTFLFFAAAVGLTLIIVDSALIAPIRDWVADRDSLSLVSKMIECYQCCGFWCGILMGGIIFYTFDPLILFACGCAASFLSMLAAGYLQYLETVMENVSIDLEEDE